LKRELAFCTHAFLEPSDVLIIPDTTLDPRFAHHPWVVAGPGIRFYAGVVLRTPERHALGTLCVTDLQPRVLTEPQQSALHALGRQVMAQLNLRRRIHEAGIDHARLTNAQRIAGLGDWEADDSKHALFWSEGIYRILGLVPTGQPPTSDAFYQRVHPDDLAFVTREKAAAAAGLRRVDFDHRIIRPDGLIRTIHQIAETTFDHKGVALRESGTLQDVTERRAAHEALRLGEERFSLVARAVSDVLWDWDLVTNAYWSSKGFLGSTGQLQDAPNRGIEGWAACIHPADHARVMDSLHHAIDSTSEYWQADYRYRCHNGSHAQVQDRGYIVRDHRGKGIRMVGGMRDMTEQRSLEARYLRAQRMEGIGSLAGGIAHDLNNVLAPILLSIDLLKLQAGTDPEYEKILDTIQLSSRRGANLVRQVLSFARGSDGERVRVLISPLVEELGGMIRDTFPRSISIVTRLAREPWAVIADPTQIHQVLLNLAVNARDAMPAGGTLALSVENVVLPEAGSVGAGSAEPRRYVLINVSDTGTGIAPEILEHIFEPFFTTKPPGVGTGLGLATVHTIVKRQGGFITVDSEPGIGTTLHVYLPVEAQPVSDLETREPQPPPPRGKGELILVVDDEPAIRLITRQTLETFGYQVLTAANGAEALALYSHHASSVALVLTDTSMPVMDGAATIAALRHLNPDLRIISTSGQAHPEADPPSAPAPLLEHLEKPYSGVVLLNRIHRLLQRAPATGATGPARS
jgi:signal transduction histidine kinase/CheY-like chemotaxis protein